MEAYQNLDLFNSNELSHTKTIESVIKELDEIHEGLYNEFRNQVLKYDEIAIEYWTSMLSNLDYNINKHKHLLEQSTSVYVTALCTDLIESDPSIVLYFDPTHKIWLGKADPKSARVLILESIQSNRENINNLTYYHAEIKFHPSESL